MSNLIRIKVSPFSYNPANEFRPEYLGIIAVRSIDGEPIKRYIRVDFYQKPVVKEFTPELGEPPQVITGDEYDRIVDYAEGIKRYMVHQYNAVMVGVS